MANILANYGSIPTIARQIRAYAQELNTEMVNVYANIADMHNCWYGKRYNELAKGFNDIRQDVNDLLELVVGDIPYLLETVANNYAQADKGSNITSAMKADPKKVATLAMPGDVGIKFNTEEVKTLQTKVSTNFQNAIKKMDIIDTTYKKIEWSSEASEAFKVKFTKLKGEIVAAFENLNTQFTKLMAKTIEDIQASESANTVG